MMLVTFQSHQGSKVKLQATIHYLYNYALSRIKFFISIISFFLLYNNAVHSLHTSVLSIATTPSRFEAHGSSLYIYIYTACNEQLCFLL